MKQRKSWKDITEEEKLEYWKIWGTYDDGFHLAYGAMANAGRNQDSS
mgnify:CR=1 FL=1